MHSIPFEINALFIYIFFRNCTYLSTSQSEIPELPAGCIKKIEPGKNSCHLCPGIEIRYPIQGELWLVKIIRFIWVKRLTQTGGSAPGSYNLLRKRCHCEEPKYNNINSLLS